MQRFGVALQLDLALAALAALSIVVERSAPAPRFPHFPSLEYTFPSRMPLHLVVPVFCPNESQGLTYYF